MKYVLGQLVRIPAHLARDYGIEEYGRIAVISEWGWVSEEGYRGPCYAVHGWFFSEAVLEYVPPEEVALRVLAGH